MGSERIRGQHVIFSDSGSNQSAEAPDTATGETFFCKIYERMYTAVDLKEHLQLHSSETLMLCPMCSRIFTKMVQLRAHIANHTKPSLKFCWFCVRSFLHTEQEQYWKHLRLHPEYQMEISHKSPSTAEDNIQYSCSQCARKFWYMASLERHLSVHRRIKSLRCPTCGVMSKDRTALSAHMELHTQEETYECEVCQKTFKHRHTLDVHQAEHRKCPYCDTKFISNFSLIRHIKELHKGLPYKGLCNHDVAAESRQEAELQVKRTKTVKTYGRRAVQVKEESFPVNIKKEIEDPEDVKPLEMAFEFSDTIKTEVEDLEYIKMEKD